MEVRHGEADCISRNLRGGPFDRISDRRIAEHAEVESLVSVLPDVFAVQNQVFAKRLRKADMEFIAVAGTEGRGGHALAAGDKALKGDDGRLETSQAGQHQVLVERRFHGSGVGDPQNRVGWLDVISDTKTRFPLRGFSDAIVLIRFATEIESPVVDIDCVLNVE